MQLQPHRLAGFSELFIKVNGKTENKMLINSVGKNTVDITGKFLLERLASTYRGETKTTLEPRLWFSLFLQNRDTNDLNDSTTNYLPEQTFSVPINEPDHINSYPIDLHYDFDFNDPTFKNGYLILVAIRPSHTESEQFMSPLDQISIPIRGDGNGK